MWAGAPSAISYDGEIYLAYRLRRPVGQGRGYVVKVARSADGVSFKTIFTVTKGQMDAESLERPALLRTDGGMWRLYLSCGTHGSKHWRVELIESRDPARFDPARRRTVLPGGAVTAVKDPVIVRHGGSWHLWAAIHPLADPGQADRMSTGYATSADGIEWKWQGVALNPRPGEWDARGARVSAVSFTGAGVRACYDGRATAAENCEEVTGIATGTDPGKLTASNGGPVAESAHGGGLRYLSIVDHGDGTQRVYYEVRRADGAHELRTEPLSLAIL